MASVMQANTHSKPGFHRTLAVCAVKVLTPLAVPGPLRGSHRVTGFEQFVQFRLLARSLGVQRSSDLNK